MTQQQLVSRSIATLLRDKSAAIAIVFALILLPIFLAVGAILDFSDAMASKSRLQQAVDSAALAAASLSTSTQAVRLSTAQSMVLANLGANSLGVTAADVTESEPSSNLYQVSATARAPTRFLGVMLINSIGISASATATTNANTFACQTKAGGNNTGGESGTNFVLSNNETVTLPDMNGKTMYVSGYGRVQFSHDANGATLIVESSCINVTSLGHDFNGSIFIANYVPLNMNKVSVAYSCNGCTFTGGSLGAGGVFAIGHDANKSSFTFNVCTNCSATPTGGGGTSRVRLVN